MTRFTPFNSGCCTLNPADCNCPFSCSSCDKETKLCHQQLTHFQRKVLKYTHKIVATENAIARLKWQVRQRLFSFSHFTNQLHKLQAKLAKYTVKLHKAKQAHLNEVRNH